MQAWLTMSAADLGRGIAKGTIDPVELTDAYLDACEASPLLDRIYARLTPERARSEAMADSIRSATCWFIWCSALSVFELSVR